MILPVIPGGRASLIPPGIKCGIPPGFPGGIVGIPPGTQGRIGGIPPGNQGRIGGISPGISGRIPGGIGGISPGINGGIPPGTFHNPGRDPSWDPGKKRRDPTWDEQGIPGGIGGIPHLILTWVKTIGKTSKLKQLVLPYKVEIHPMICVYRHTIICIFQINAGHVTIWTH